MFVCVHTDSNVFISVRLTGWVLLKLFNSFFWNIQIHKGQLEMVKAATEVGFLCSVTPFPVCGSGVPSCHVSLWSAAGACSERLLCAVSLRTHVEIPPSHPPCGNKQGLSKMCRIPFVIYLTTT